MKILTLLAVLVGSVLCLPQEIRDHSTEVRGTMVFPTAKPTLSLELYLPPSMTTPSPPPNDYLPPSIDTLPNDYLPPSLETLPNDYLPPILPPPNDYLPPTHNDYVEPSDASINSKLDTSIKTPLSSKIMMELLRRGRSSLFSQKDMTTWIDMIQQIMSRMQIQIKRC